MTENIHTYNANHNINAQPTTNSKERETGDAKARVVDNTLRNISMFTVATDSEATPVSD
jgi:hypothetical protein